MLESDLARTEERAEKAEASQAKREQQLEEVESALRSLEMGEEKIMEKRQNYEIALKASRDRLQEAETRAEFAERSVQKLEKEVDRLEQALVNEREKYKHISDELDQTFSELTAC